MTVVDRGRDDTPELPAELVEHLNRGDCVLFVGDAMGEGVSTSTRLASVLVDACDAHVACPIPACRSGGRCSQPMPVQCPWRVVRGGSFSNDRDTVQATYRNRNNLRRAQSQRQQ